VRSLLLILLALVLAALQAAVLRWAGGGAVPLALPLALVVHLGLTAGTVEGAVTAAGIGYVVDLTTGGPKGLMTSLAVGLYLFSRLAGASVDVHGRVGFGVLTAVGVLLYGAAALGVTDLVTPAEVAPRWALMSRVALEAAATGVASVWLLPILRRIDGLFHREEPGLLR
jgi:rod shape-determining protein MreD